MNETNASKRINRLGKSSTTSQDFVEDELDVDQGFGESPMGEVLGEINNNLDFLSGNLPPNYSFWFFIIVVLLIFIIVKL